MYDHPGTTVSPAVGIGVGSKGRVSLILPFDAILKITTFGVTIILSIVCLILWGIATIWHPLCWGVVIYAILNTVRKSAQAYMNGRKS